MRKPEEKNKELISRIEKLEKQVADLLTRPYTINIQPSPVTYPPAPVPLNPQPWPPYPSFNTAQFF